MIDINNQELLIGDYILVAYNSCSNQYLKYATITNIENDTIKIRFNPDNVSKTKTLTRPWNYRILKIKGNE